MQLSCSCHLILLSSMLAFLGDLLFFIRDKRKIIESLVHIIKNTKVEWVIKNTRVLNSYYIKCKELLNTIA